MVSIKSGSLSTSHRPDQDDETEGAIRRKWNGWDWKGSSLLPHRKSIRRLRLSGRRVLSPINPTRFDEQWSVLLSSKVTIHKCMRESDRWMEKGVFSDSSKGLRSNGYKLTLLTKALISGQKN